MKGLFQKVLKKGFYVPYEDSSVYPTVSIAKGAIAKYCELNHHSYTFLSDESVEIDGVAWKIERRIEPGSRGNYGIKCKEM